MRESNLLHAYRCSDGSTPQQQTEQILAITPILPGQRAAKTPTAIRDNHQATSTTAAPLTKATPISQQVDLIDFGQSSITAPNDRSLDSPQSAQKENQNQNQGQRQLEQMLTATSTSVHVPASATSNEEPLEIHKQSLVKPTPLEYDHQAGDSKENMLTRRDTDSQSLDNFVDAEG